MRFVKNFTLPDFQAENITLLQGGRSYAKARRAFADLDENSKHWHTPICCDIKICRDLRTFWRTGAKKCFFLKQHCSSGKKWIITWYIVARRIVMFLSSCDQNCRVSSRETRHFRCTVTICKFLHSPKGSQLLPPCTLNFTKFQQFWW